VTRGEEKEREKRREKAVAAMTVVKPIESESSACHTIDDSMCGPVCLKHTHTV